MELGILSLSDLQHAPATGQRVSAAARTREIISYVFGVDLSQYDEIFAEKLELLLALRNGSGSA